MYCHQYILICKHQYQHLNVNSYIIKYFTVKNIKSCTDCFISIVKENKT